MEVAEKPSTELTLPQRAAVALGSSELEQNLKALAKKHTDIVAVNDGTGRDQVHGAAMTLKSNRVAIQKTAKAAREDATAFQKAVIAEENRLVEIIEPEEKRLLELRDGYDAKVQAEREAKIAAERARVDAIKARITFIANAPLTAVGLPSVGIDRIIQSLLSEVLDDSYEEFLPEAQVAHAKALEQLQSAIEAAMHAEQQAAQEAADRAAEAKRIVDERAELERQRKEQEATAAAERKKLADERAKQDKEREEADAKAAALRKEEDDKREVERKRVENELAEQRAELARQQEVINAARREQEEAARAAQAKIDADAKEAADAEAKRLQDVAEEAERVANEEHRKTVAKAAVAAMSAGGVPEEHALLAVLLIMKDQIPNITITY